MATRNVVKAMVDLEDRLSRKLKGVARSVRNFDQDQTKGKRGTDGWSKSLDKWSGKVHNYFGSKTKSLVSGWFTSLKISAAIGFAGITAGVASSVRDFAKFDASLRNTTGLMAGAGDVSSGQADKAYARYKDQVLKLAPKMAKGPQDLAESLYDIVGSGFQGDAATKVLEVAAKGASAGSTDTTVVAGALVKTLAAYNLEAKDAAGITDEMFQSVNLGILSFEDMAQNLGDVVGLASTAKVSFSDLMASIALMTRQGMVPAEAFTALNQLMLGIMAPGTAEKEAANAIFGKDVEKDWGAKAVAAKGLGGVMQGLMKKLAPSDDQLARLNSVNEQVGEMAAAEIAGDKIDVLTALFGNVRALRGALVLASDGTYDFAKAQEDMGGAVGATDRVLEEQEKSVQKQFDRIGSQFDVLKIQLMEDIAPAIGEKVKGVSDWFTEITELPEYENGTASEKIKLLGSKVWEWVSNWWSENKAAVSARISAGIEWMAGEATPKIVEWGAKIGAELVPAIFKGMMSTTPGTLLVAGVAASWANKLGPGIGQGIAASAPTVPATGGGAAGAAGAGATGAGTTAATGAGFKQGVVAPVLAIAAAAFAVNEARISYNKNVKVVDEAAGSLKADSRKATDAELAAGAKAADKFNLGEELYGLLPDRKTSSEVIKEEQDRRTPLRVSSAIRTYQNNDMLAALKSQWDNFDPSVLAAGDRSKIKNSGITADPSVVRSMFANAGNFNEVATQYGSDPTKLTAQQRHAMEFLIDNTTSTVKQIEDVGKVLSTQGLDPTEFGEKMADFNPIMRDMEPVTAEWVLRMTAARDHMVNVNKVLYAANQSWIKENWTGWGVNNPENPTGNGSKEQTPEEKAAAYLRAGAREALAKTARENANKGRVAGSIAGWDPASPGTGYDPMGLGRTPGSKGGGTGLFNTGGDGRFYQGDSPFRDLGPIITKGLNDHEASKPKEPTPAPQVNFNAPFIGQVMVAKDDDAQTPEELAKTLSVHLVAQIAKGLFEHTGNS